MISLKIVSDMLCARLLRVLRQTSSPNTRFASCLCYYSPVSISKRHFGTTTTIKPVLDREIDTDLNQEVYKAKKHPGIRRIGNVYLPKQLRDAAKIILEDYHASDLLEASKSLTNFLNSRKQPVENFQIRSAAEEIEKSISTNDETEMAESKLKDKVMNKLKKTVYHWKPVEYDMKTGLMYLLGKFSSDFAALTRVLAEIQMQDSDFRPKTVFDFGSGLGSVIWAVQELWPDCIKEYFAVDASADMNKISSLLLQGGNESYPSDPRAYFRQFLPASSKISYELVVSAFTLLELPSARSRLETIETLWRKADKYMVLVENGSNAGFEAITEARDFILQKSSQEVHVFAPCPHDSPCPRYTDGTNTPCNFEVKFKPIDIGKPRDFDTARFSYVILKKGQKHNEKVWPRIVRPVILRPRNAVCRLCCANGDLKEFIVTSKKHGKNLYKCSRKSRWGDLLPVSLKSTDDQHESSHLKSLEDPQTDHDLKCK